MARKLALLIGNNQYDDQTLKVLKTPEADVHALAEMLRSPKIGEFDEVQELTNVLEGELRRRIAAFFEGKKPDDLLLLYFSGHGVLDAQGKLFLAVKDTNRSLLKATAVPASFIAEVMDECRSKRQVLVLDCCNSGAYARSVKGEAKVLTQATFAGNGYGRVVLTATDTTQYALEGDKVITETKLSLFTHYLLEGLTGGAADVDRDGWISVDEWYEYAYGKVIGETPAQTPHKWNYKGIGKLLIAHSAPVELPPELRQALESPLAGVRTGAVSELETLLNGAHAGLAQAARAALEELAEDDSRKVSAAARDVLAKGGVKPGVTAAPVPEIGRQVGEGEHTAPARVMRDKVEPTKAPQVNAAKDELCLPLAPGVDLILLRIPAGEFLMGSDKAKDPEAGDNELPQHKVYLDEYWIGKYPVTVAQFNAFVQAGYRWGSKPDDWNARLQNKADHPMTDVNWFDAVSFCQWAAKISGQKVRLPSEAEWEKAARGTDGRIYPWGNQAPDANHCNFDGSGIKDTTPVGQYSLLGDSPYGCDDMAGNVWEWVNDWYDGGYYKNAPVRNPSGPAKGDLRVLRGGSWDYVDIHARSAIRGRDDPGHWSCNHGFRVCRSP